jgi:hypothetical protein
VLEDMYKDWPCEQLLLLLHLLLLLCSEETG